MWINYRPHPCPSKNESVMKERYPVVFLSLGPGDPELLTLKAVKVLREADVVMVPASMKSGKIVRSRAADIIAEWCPLDRQQCYALPMMKDRRAAMEVYDRIFADVQAGYQEGRRVVVAVEGDVSIYASIHYVLDRLSSAGVPVQQVPGIPSFVAAASVANLSLVSGGQSLVVLPGNATPEQLEQLLATQHEVVVMKLSQCQDAVKCFLSTHETVQCYYFEQIGTPDAFFSTDRTTILERPMPYFSLMVLKQ